MGHPPGVIAVVRSLITASALLFLSACAEIRESRSTQAQYQAYGKTWSYYTVERYTKSWGVDTPHGIMGWRERLEQFVYLTTDDGERIPVHERIYALQRDGSYKKVECCNSVLIQAAVRNFDNKLIVYFKQTRENTTDCFVYPEGHPDDEKEPEPKNRYRYVQLFGEFDPQMNVFRVHDFLPSFSREEFRKTVGYRANSEQTEAFFYSNRRPFICDAAR
jgi:hypothetical protein